MTLQEKLIQALQLQSAGDVAGASRLFLEILEVDRDNVYCLYSLGLIELNAGHSQQALDLCNRGVAATPEFAPLHFTYCSDDDICEFKPVMSHQSFNLYLIDGREHCLALTTDATIATGIVVAEIVADELL